MTTSLDFLTQPNNERLRKEIENICDSYSHPWDILAELCQNSVDAIHSHIRNYGEKLKEHEIHISINSVERSITVRDTGVGFSPGQFVDLLAPHGTNKAADDLGNIGQKGVGLTYVIFSSDQFNLKSKSVNGSIDGNIENAVLWKKGKIQDVPSFLSTECKTTDVDPKDTFTEVFIRGAEETFEEDEDIFVQSPEILEFILRTRTAIGSTSDMFEGEQEKMHVMFTFKSKDGNVVNKPITPSFMLPEEFVLSSDWIDYDDFVTLAATLDDRQKTKKLQGKCLRKKGSITRSGRDIKYYGFFAPKRKFWKDISDRNKLMRYSSDLKEEVPLYQSGIYVSSRSMPTGITLTPPSTGEAGYWPNLFLMLEDNRIVFDLGRKFVPGRTQGLLKEIARSLFNDFIKFRKYITTEPPTHTTISTTVQQHEKNTIFEEMKKLPDLNASGINYRKHPNSQEAAVVAIFHELVGAQKLKGYFSLKHGYKETYDLWAYYRALKNYVGTNVSIEDGTELPVIIEFKYSAEDILIDFEKRIKSFSDIDLIVCWKLDSLKFSKDNVQVRVLKPEDALFHGSNYELEWPGTYNLGAAGKKPVLALETFIDALQRSQ